MLRPYLAVFCPDQRCHTYPPPPHTLQKIQVFLTLLSLLKIGKFFQNQEQDLSVPVPHSILGLLSPMNLS